MSDRKRDRKMPIYIYIQKVRERDVAMQLDMQMGIKASTDD